ncbi:MAG: hypothetical protein GXO08_03340 [Aquificae bacterium]|nr:hypothetical protein [Aquificota bacterium]
MMRRILAIRDFKEAFEFLPNFKTVVKEVKPDAIVFAGSVLKGTKLEEEYHSATLMGRPPRREVLHEVEKHQVEVLNEFFKTLGETGVKTFIVPGKNDAPLKVYLRALAQMEEVYPNLRGVHETFANWGSEFVVFGLGGKLNESVFEEDFVVKYPRWYAEYVLKFMYEMKPKRKLMVLHHPPIGKKVDVCPDGKHRGSAISNTLIKTFNPEIAIVGLAGRGYEKIGDTLVVNPGPMYEGYFAVVDAQDKKVEYGDLR